MGLFCSYNRGSLSIIIGLPVRATPNQNLSSIYVQKRQNGGRNFQRALRVPFIPSSMGRFCGWGWRGQVISGRLANSFESGFEKDKKLLRGVIGHISAPNDYLNTVFG